MSNFSHLREWCRLKNLDEPLKAGALSTPFMKAVVSIHPLHRLHDVDTNQVIIEKRAAANGGIVGLKNIKMLSLYFNFDIAISGTGITLEEAEKDYRRNFRKVSEEHEGLALADRLDEHGLEFNIIPITEAGQLGESIGRKKYGHLPTDILGETEPAWLFSPTKQ